MRWQTVNSICDKKTSQISKSTTHGIQQGNSSVPFWLCNTISKLTEMICKYETKDGYILECHAIVTSACLINIYVI